MATEPEAAVPTIRPVDWLWRSRAGLKHRDAPITLAASTYPTYRPAVSFNGSALAAAHGSQDTRPGRHGAGRLGAA